MAKLSKIKGKVSETYRDINSAISESVFCRIVVERKLAGKARSYINKVKVDE